MLRRNFNSFDIYPKLTDKFSSSSEVLSKVLLTAIRGWQSMARQAQSLLFGKEWDMCSHIQYMCDPELSQPRLVSGIAFVTYRCE